MDNKILKEKDNILTEKRMDFAEDFTEDFVEGASSAENNVQNQNLTMSPKKTINTDTAAPVEERDDDFAEDTFSSLHTEDEKKPLSNKDFAKTMLKRELTKTELDDFENNPVSLDDITFGQYFEYLKGRYPGSSRSKSTVQLVLFKYFGDLEDENEIFNTDNYDIDFDLSTNAADVNLSFAPGIRNGSGESTEGEISVMLDLVFNTATTPELASFNNKIEYFIEKYGEYAANEKITDIPQININIMADCFVGMHYLTLKNPVFYALTSQNVGMMPNVLRMIFNYSDIEINEIEESELEGLSEEIAYLERYQSDIENN